MKYNKKYSTLSQQISTNLGRRRVYNENYLKTNGLIFPDHIETNPKCGQFTVFHSEIDITGGRDRMKHFEWLAKPGKVGLRGHSPPVTEQNSYKGDQQHL